jgi:predicted ATPase/transcriptional regulator with XRE-family HTH domain
MRVPVRMLHGSNDVGTREPARDVPEGRSPISRFGTALRHYRVRAGLSQEGLAERAGLSVRGISDLERGARTFPRLETVRMLADALDLNERDRAALLAAARPELETDAPPVPAPPHQEKRINPRPLPIPPTRLVGRDDEIRRVVELFRGGETRLITLTGQGGIGKTRLGLAIARGFHRELGGRVAFLELAGVRDPALVPGAIATQLDVPVEAGASAAQVIAQAIGPEPMLLVTDNWEHVIDAAPVLSVLLAHCEGLWVLATSRERLRLRGEWELHLDPLPVPESDALDVETIGEVPAVRLFVQRASEALDGFALDAVNAPTVVEICRRLDGIPLAIELAAARMRLFTPEQLLNRLEGRFQLLTEGPRDLPERLQTMRSAISWSVDLLDADERRLFERLSIFDGGFTIPAVVGVLSQIEPEVEREAIEERLVSLVEKSLIRPVDGSGDEPRFLMYETIRDFAAELFGTHDDPPKLADAHACHFLAVAEAAEPGLMSADPLPTFELLEADIGNLRSAMGYFRDRGDAEEALRIASAMAWFWTEPRFLAEGQRWLGSLLAHPATSEAPRTLRVRALIAAGDLAIWQGELDEATALHEEALDLLRDLDDERQLAAVLRSLANVALERNEFDRADRLLSESRELARSSGNAWEVAASANLLGLSKAMQGAPDWAIERHREAVEIWRELGDTGHVFDALAGLGWAHLLAEQYAESAGVYLEALPLAVESDDVLQIEWCIRAAAAIAAARGTELERAIRLFSVSEAMREATGIDLRVSIGETLDQLMESARHRLGRERFARGWQAGQRMTREQALDEARLVFEKAQA